ncbi:glycosyltransferase family 2 protein [Mucilaginibacter arboris]|uniref:Glycosyltransferase n=1 Tax=Mucilaginibacter arboris TaxID=2682090 RepID=A0A7K1SZ56_9SPHI|nr:glycosyltransferase [Mucilaginibacter arboris]MVN22606.1 glycosyltransferase [Mucilaginibacter arboris]
MKASFVIVNYNRKEEVLLTISKTKNIIKFDPANFEIIIIDNASTDGSATAIKDEYPDVILIENKVNIGISAWNTGFSIAKGNYFIILDDDSHIDNGLEKALLYLDNHTDIGVLALNITGGAFQTCNWNNLAEYAGFIGCGAIMSKELYEKIGGYADWIFLYTHEFEYAIRCKQAGYKIIFFADCQVTHRTSAINRTSKRLITLSFRNELGIVYKYFQKKDRTLYLTRVFFNNIKYIFRHGIKSVSWYYNGWKEFNKLKKDIQFTPVNDDVQNFYSRYYPSTQPFLKII